MSVQISLHAASLEQFLRALATDRQVQIADAGCDERVLSRLHLSGDEQRPFTDQEVAKVLSDYRYYEAYFSNIGLWPAASTVLSQE